MPRPPGGAGTPALDTSRHILYLNGGSSSLSGASITALSLTGEFEAKTFSFPATQVPVGIPHLSVDTASGMVYAVGSPAGDGVDQLFATSAAKRQVFVYAFRSRVVDGGINLEFAWSYYVGDNCESASHKALRFFGVSADGRRLSFGCVGFNFFYFGFPHVGQNGIMNLALPDPYSVPPWELSNDDPRIFKFFEAVPGGGTGTVHNQDVSGDHNTKVMVWNTGTRILLWDVNRGMWIGSANLDGFTLAQDPASRRVYLQRGAGIGIFQVANLPGDVERVSVSHSLDGIGSFNGPYLTSAFDPRTRRMLTRAVIPGKGFGVAVLEDRIPPPIAFAEPNPDSRTHDVEEDRAYSVSRNGATKAYGARVWWTGTGGTMPGSYLLREDGNLNDTGVSGPVPPPGLTYEWLFEDPLLLGKEFVHPSYASRLKPFMPYRGQRQLLSARVDGAELASNSSYFSSEVSGFSSASAWGLDIDDKTDEDARHRRGTQTFRELVVTDFETACNYVFSSFLRPQCEQQWGPGTANRKQWDKFYYGDPSNPEGFKEGASGHAKRFDDCVLELVDRMMREIDGGRRVRLTDEEGNPNPCFAQFDANDPQRDPSTGETGRPGLEQREEIGLTQRSKCEDWEGTPAEASTGGSKVSCDLLNALTAAGAEGALSLPFGNGATLKVEGSLTGTQIFRDPYRGMVARAAALASGVSFEVPGQGGFRIGAVGTLAETWATGRPGPGGAPGAQSSYRVGYTDVTVKTANGEVVYSCAPDETVGQKAEEQKSKVQDALPVPLPSPSPIPGTSPQPSPSPLPTPTPLPAPVEAPEDSSANSSPGSQRACNPDDISTALSKVFGAKVLMRVPPRDLDPNVVGTNKGAQAIVRRNRADYYNEWVLFDSRRDELPGLTMTINLDGTTFNRYQIDLAGVFASSFYYIGEEVPEVKVLPASVTVSLEDTEGAPLEGGEFELIADLDEDGTLSADDKALAKCTTGSDGVGDCSFPSLDPGLYLVRQVTAPPGYLPTKEPTTVDATPGSELKVPFVNYEDAATVEIILTDPSDSPLEGGVFEVGAAGGGSPVSCTTDAQGRCDIFPLPLGAYAVSQTSAPEGYVAADPIEFALTAPGQIARIAVVNGLPEIPGIPGTPGTFGSGSVMELEIIEPAIELVAAESAEPPIGGFWRRIGRGLAQAIERNPAQAVALALLMVLGGLPIYLAARRRELSIMRELT